jgi:hypothetical protein
MGDRRRWTPEAVVQSLRRRVDRGLPVSYRAVQKSDRPLLAAARYHFKSWDAALTAAGLKPVDARARPLWTKERVIAVLKKHRRGGADMSWSAAISGPSELKRAAFASIRKRMFGNWARALRAAGVDVDEHARQRLWSREEVAWELRQRHADGLPMNSAAVQHDDAGLHSAARRYFKRYDLALRAARLSPASHRLRKSARRRHVSS